MIARYLGSRLHYAWIVAAVTFLTLICTAGVRSMPGVLIVPLEQQFGWSRATISLAVSLNLLLYGLCGPFAAALMDRYGLRRVMTVALATVAVAVALTTRMQEAWQLYLLWGGMVGAATGATASVLAAVVANRWFTARKGLVVGVLTASNATGQLIFLPLLSSLVVTLGWRVAAATVAVVILLVLVPVALLMRDRPRDLDLLPYGATGSEEITAPPANPFKAALGGLALGMRTPDFWLLAGSFYICGASTNGLIGTHLIPASMEHGIPEVQAASMLAVIGIFDVIGTTISGWLSDRVDNRWLLCWYYTFRGLSLLFLPYALGSSFLYLAVFVVFYGLDWVATVPPTVRLATEIFGKARMGVVYGWIFAAHQLGAATAAFGAGALHTWLGDYQVAFLTSGVLCLLAAGMVIRIGRVSGGITLPAPALEAEAAATA
jgi:sugar phosphate permease